MATEDGEYYPLNLSVIALTSFGARTDAAFTDRLVAIAESFWSNRLAVATESEVVVYSNSAGQQDAARGDASARFVRLCARARLRTQRADRTRLRRRARRTRRRRSRRIRRRLRRQRRRRARTCCSSSQRWIHTRAFSDGFFNILCTLSSGTRASCSSGRGHTLIYIRTV